MSQCASNIIKKPYQYISYLRHTQKDGRDQEIEREGVYTVQGTGRAHTLCRAHLKAEGAGAEEGTKTGAGASTRGCRKRNTLGQIRSSR